MNYLSIEEAIQLHDEILEISGGKRGYNNISLGYLRSALEQIKNDNFYPSITEKVTHLVFSCIKFHPFLDGNKRTSIYLAMIFLDFNGVDVQDFAQKMEDVVVDVAENKISKGGLLEILKKIVDG